MHSMMSKAKFPGSPQPKGTTCPELLNAYFSQDQVSTPPTKATWDSGMTWVCHYKHSCGRQCTDEGGKGN